MTAQGATLQSYNSELVRCIEQLHDKRQSLTQQITLEEAKRAEILHKQQRLAAQLAKLDRSLQIKHRQAKQYTVTIQETESAYLKILESSQTLLHVLKRETVALVKDENKTQSQQLMIGDIQHSPPVAPKHHHHEDYDDDEQHQHSEPATHRSTHNSAVQHQPQQQQSVSPTRRSSRTHILPDTNIELNIADESGFFDDDNKHSAAESSSRHHQSNRQSKHQSSRSSRHGSKR
jgi:sjoegren syndrome nuclear autoantigen 1